VLALKLFSAGLGFILVLLTTWWATESSAVVTYGQFSDHEIDFSLSRDPGAWSPVSSGDSGFSELVPISRAPRVGIQVGHWKNDTVPEELAALSGSGPGARVGKLTERSVMLSIARAAAHILEQHGVIADVLPAVVPPAYCADAFIALHADASMNAAVSGYKVAASSFDTTKGSRALAAAIAHAYALHTGLRQDTAITDRMQQYYAFNYPAFSHAVDSRTPSVILEAGYLTNVRDRTLLYESPEQVAYAIATGALTFIETSSGCRK
jgi:N-acetylmuramoyl-L-alanine amidase